VAQQRECIGWTDVDAAFNPPEMSAPGEIDLLVPKPKTDQRYGFSYRLTRRSTALPERCRVRLDKLLDECRCTPASAGSFSHKLTTAMLAIYQRILGNGGVDPQSMSGDAPFFVG